MASVRGIRRKLHKKTVADRNREQEAVRQMEENLKHANLLWWLHTSPESGVDLFGKRFGG